jgi:glycosyltransferase involved in cell wall biosynthesis
MRVLLVGNYPIDGQVSMDRFAQALRQGLSARGHAVDVLAPRPMLLRGVTGREGIAKWVGYVNKYVLFPWVLRRTAPRYDVIVVCDHANAVYVPWLRGRPHLVVCHDVIAIRVGLRLYDGWPMGLSGRVLQRWILRSLRRAMHVVCVSDYTRDQLLELAPELRDRTAIVHNGLNFAFCPTPESAWRVSLATRSIADRPYFLHVGSALPRKNRAFLVHVLAALRSLEPSLPHRLVFAGAPIDEDVLPVARALGLERDVVGLARIDNEVLRDLYSGATALLFPSHSEGFGWPVIEAQACGCPVFASNRRPMIDIGGPALVPFDPEDAAGAARAILDALPDLPLVRAASLQNAARFSFEAMIEGYVRELAGCDHASIAARSLTDAPHANA